MPTRSRPTTAFSPSIPVRDKVPVLLVNGDPSIEPLKGETDFAEIALQPYNSAAGSRLRPHRDKMGARKIWTARDYEFGGRRPRQRPQTRRPQVKSLGRFVTAAAC